MTLNSDTIKRYMKQYQILFIVLGLFIISAIVSPYFFRVNNILNVLKQTSIRGFVALGMTFVILSGGIDLSIGAIVALSTVLVTGFAMNFPPILGIYISLFAGAACGVFNGTLITKLKFQPFIASLAIMAIARGAAMVYSNSQPIFGSLPKEYFLFSDGILFRLPFPFILFVIFSLIAGLFLKYTGLGRSIYQIGGSEEVARLSGLRTDRVKLFVYTLNGILAALAGLILAARMQSGDSVVVGLGWELDAIAAVTIGGTSIKGGRGTIFGTVCGVLIITIIGNVFNLLGINPYWQRIVTGFIICLAVWIYQK